MEELEKVEKALNQAILELKSLKEDEEVQTLLDVPELANKPSIFTHPLADIIRELKVNEELKKENEETVFEEEKQYMEQIEQTSKIRKSTRRSAKQQKALRASNMPKPSTLSMPVKKHNSREIKFTRASQVTRVSQAPTPASRKSKMVDSSDGSHSGSEEITHIVNIFINKDLQKELKCEVGVDIFMEVPWKIISRSSILRTLSRDGERSPFFEFASNLQIYPEEEVLVGRATLLDCDSFLVAITIHGRNVLLEEIRSAHLARWGKVMMRQNHPIGKWKSLGTEEEMHTSGVKHTRPQISLDCYIKKDYHEKLFSEGFDVVEFYTELREDGLLMIENIEGVVFDKQTQGCPLTQESYAQTVPEIPVNAATQFTTEMRVEEYKEKLEELDLDYEVLNEKLKGFYYKIDNLLTYNEEYDLYRDDYEILATEGEDISMYPNLSYEHYATMMTFIGTKDKVITSTSWHPSQAGIVAVAYGRDHIAKVGDLNNNSDEEEANKDFFDEEELFNNFPTSNEFDEYIEKLWKAQIHKLEKDMKKGKHDTKDYDLATVSTEFLLQTKHIRLFEIIQEKKRLLKTPDAEDLYKEEKFEYPLFDKSKRKKKDDQNESIDSIINKVMSEKPDYLRRDNLFSGNFHWKLKMADEIINPIDLIITLKGGTVPKQFVRTFLFPEIWGETWFFGDDLKYDAIEVNKDFRESALMALGLPTVPESKVFLPGYKVEDNIDYTLEMNPWQWMDAWVQHCKYREENNIKSPDEDENSDIPESDHSDVEDAFGFLFLRNMPLYDVEYEHVNLQYFLCDRKDCEHCPYIINNIMKKEGIDHLCLKIIMNKDNPNEVEKVIALPYEHVHGSFEKKEDKVVLQKKKKKNEDDHETFEDEFELPFCSSENGCLLRKLLPGYLKDSKAKKLYCDQCVSVQNSENKDLDGYDLFLEESDKNINDSESVNKDTTTSESGVSNIIWDEECTDNVGQFLDVSKNFTKQKSYSENKGMSPDNLGIQSEDVCQSNKKIALTSINPIDIREKLNQLSFDMDEIKSLHNKELTISSENQEDNEESISPMNLFFNNESINKPKHITTFDDEKPDMVLVGDTIEIQHNVDKFSSSSSSTSFRSALENVNDDESILMNRKSSIRKSQETSRISNITSNILSDKNTESQMKNTNGKSKSLSTKSKQDTIEFKDDSEGEEVCLDIKHVLDDPYDNSRDFDKNTKMILDEEIAKLNSGLSSKVVNRPFEVMSSCVSSHELIENSDDEEDVDKLNLAHHVAIWNLGNDIKPMQRLISPFELTCISFCPFNGRYLIGGTSSGQVVLWDLEDKLNQEEFKIQERSDFDLIGFKHLERVMCWFKRVRPNQTPENRLYITAISNRVTSHMDRIIDINWLPPNLKLSRNTGKFEEVDLKDGFSLQFMSTSVDGVILCWDLNSPPLPFNEAHINKYSFQRPGQFKLPKNPNISKSKLKEFFLRWNPFYKIRLEQRDNVGVKRFYVTNVSHDQAIYSYERDSNNPKLAEINIGLKEYYKVESVGIDAMNHEVVVGTIDGSLILFTWKRSGPDGVYDDQEGTGSSPTCFYKQIHDGPINKIKRHPANNKIFLSAGGHVFGLWRTDQDEPLKWKRYNDCYVTAVNWTRHRASSFRVGRSDGCLEVWDMYENGNEPKMTLQVSPGAVYDIIVPILPTPLGIFGITDDKGILKFYVLPWEYQLPRDNEREIFFDKVEAEHQRKLLIDKAAADKIDVIEGEISQDLDEHELSEADLKEKESEEMIKKKELIGCRKFKDELYKWYLRRRGKNAAWLDEAEKKWFLKEQEYMIKTILQNKQINLQELDDAIEPLYKKEKHTKEVAVKILDVLEMADDIFKKAVKELVLVRNYQNQSQVSLEMEKMNFGELEDTMEAIDLYFGKSYEKTEEELSKFVEMNPITKEWTFAELCEKNQYIRDAWNDRRRLLKKEHKWSRELIAEELGKAGHEYSYYVNHEESYLKKKYQRRIENIEQLKKIYGDDYDPYWDLHGKYGSRNKNKSEPHEQKSGTKQKFNEYVDIFNVHPDKPSLKHPLHEVNVVLPEGSFYRKYMPAEKNIPWEKPIPYEERVYSRSKRFKDKLGDSEMSVTSESSSSMGPTNLDDVEPDYHAEAENIKNSVRKSARPVNDSDSEQSESSSSSTSKENVEKEQEKEPSKVSVDQKTKGSVRFNEQRKLVTLAAKDIEKKEKKEIDFEKEDISGRYHGLEDLRRLVKEKKMRGEEFIDIDDLSSYSYESVLGPISSSASSPDMSLKSEDFASDVADIDDDSEDEYFKEQLKEFLEETPRYDPPKVVPYDGSVYEDEPTEEWMEDDLKLALKPKDQDHEEESEGEEEGLKKPDMKTTAIMEKEKAVRDKVEELLAMEESSDIINTAPPPSGSKDERLRHPFENKCMEDVHFPE